MSVLNATKAKIELNHLLPKVTVIVLSNSMITYKENAFYVHRP